MLQPFLLCSTSGTGNREPAWFVCSDLKEGTGLWVLWDNYCFGWYHNRVAHVLQAWLEVPVCVAKLGGEPRETVFTAKLWSLVYGRGEDCFLDVGARFRDDTRTCFVVRTDPKIRECGFVPGILASVLKWNELGFPLFPCPLPGLYCSTLSCFSEFQIDDDQEKVMQRLSYTHFHSLI